MRTIDADAVADRVRRLKSQIATRAAGFVDEDSYECGAVDALHDALTYLDEAPTVDAVPLDKLCEWLAGYADPPKYAMKIIPESGKCLINARAKAWEHHFRNMLECGLMEDEDE